MKIVKLTSKPKELLLKYSVNQAVAFCKKNKIEMPYINCIVNVKHDLYYGCGEYIRKSKGINICLHKCSHIGNGLGRNYSSPSSKVDRTPFGVLSHELGHHIDFEVLTNKNTIIPTRELSLHLFSNKKERVTGYEPNHHEAFAESMRLFINNPDLLKQACPYRYEFISDILKLKPLYRISWQDMLAKRGTAPAIVKAVTNWVNKQQKIIPPC